MAENGLPGGTTSALCTAIRSRPSVLLVTDSLEPSGIGEHMVTLASALQPDAQTTLVFADTPGAIPWFRRAGHAGLDAVLVPPVALIEGGSALAAVLGDCRPEVIHVHAGIGWEGHGVLAAARELGNGGTAIVRTEHLPYLLWALKNPALEAAYLLSMRQVDRVICVSEAARDTFRICNMNMDRFAVVRNGIIPRQPTRSRVDMRAALGAGDDRLILTIARFTEQKGHAVLLDALPAVLAACPDVCLVWAGTGPYENSLRARAEALGVGDRVRFLGRRDDVPDLMAAADMFCLPSFFEGHPLVVLEAMAAGLPVIATRSLGMTEAICNGETGLLVPVDHASALAAALIRVLDDAAFANRLGTAARASVQAHFSAQRMARETVEIYRAALDAQKNRCPAVLNRSLLLTRVEQVWQIRRHAEQQFPLLMPFRARRKSAFGMRNI
jgi:glycosyltransferase involved in cell wall biosynthesis